MEEKTLTFQQAMKRLEAITNLLNQPDLELEDAMNYFEEAIRLTKQCESQLNQFEDRVNQLIHVEEDDHA